MNNSFYGGKQGNGIEEIKDLGVNLENPNLHDYVICFTNGEEFKYSVQKGDKGDKGNGIDYIEGPLPVEGEPLKKKYLIHFTDEGSESFEFFISDGEKGDKGDNMEISLNIPGPEGKDPEDASAVGAYIEENYPELAPFTSSKLICINWTIEGTPVAYWYYKDTEWHLIPLQNKVSILKWQEIPAEN